MPLTTIVLIHLGDSIPWYLRDCVHQLRLWNPSRYATRIHILLEREPSRHQFWKDLEQTYGVSLHFTDTLSPTNHHREFLRAFQAAPPATQFRNGFWKFVRERFFFLEEFIRDTSAGPVLALEYDVLLYQPAATLAAALQRYAPTSLAAVKDAPGRIHPGLLWVPTLGAISNFTQFVAAAAATRPELEDMQLLHEFQTANPTALQFLPTLPSDRNFPGQPRFSHSNLAPQPAPYLSAGFDQLQTLFDSAVVGQFVGGIDPRNTGGAVTTEYQNETALYNFKEFEFAWVKVPGPTPTSNPLWQPQIDGVPLASIHMHSKALFCFLSDRADEPKANYDVGTLLKQLEPN